MQWAITNAKVALLRIMFTRNFTMFNNGIFPLLFTRGNITCDFFFYRFNNFINYTFYFSSTHSWKEFCTLSLSVDLKSIKLRHRFEQLFIPHGLYRMTFIRRLWTFTLILVCCSLLFKTSSFLSLYLKSRWRMLWKISWLK